MYKSLAIPLIPGLFKIMILSAEHNVPGAPIILGAIIGASLFYTVAVPQKLN